MNKKLSLLLSVFIFAVISIFMMTAKPAYADGDFNPVGEKPGGLECHWITSGQIICTWKGGTIKDLITDRGSQTNCSQVLSYTCIDFWFDAPASKEMGFPVFTAREGDHERYVVFPQNDASKAFFIWHRPPLSFDYKNTNANTSSNVKVTNAKLGQVEARGNDCSLLRTGNCEARVGSVGSLSGAGLDAGPFNKTLAEVAKQESIMDTCNNSVKLGFIFCPILEAINNGIAATIGGAEVVQGERKGIFISFLQLEPLIGKEAEGKSINNVVNNVVTVANVLYVFIFLAIIFSSSLPLGLSNYTIKKMLPKFIAAVILTQFSLLICGLVVDFFNLLGQIVPNVIFFLGAGTTTAIGSTTDLVVGGMGLTILGGIGIAASSGLLGAAFILILIFAFIALISIFVAMVYMIIRYFVLYALVIISPLAFVAWVLPGTEKFFYTWWKNFIRLNAMFVTIMGMLALALLMSSILGGITDNPIQSLIAALIPCVALLLVPKTLKWTTQGMSALAGGALTAVGAKGGAMAKSMSSKGTQKAKSMVNEKRQEQSAIQFGKGRARTGAVLAGRLPTAKGKLLTSRESEAFIQERNKNNRASLKYAGSKLDFKGYNDELLKVARGEGSSTLGVGKSNSAMQIAAIGELAGRGQWESLRNDVYDVGRSSGGSQVVTENMFAQGIEPHVGDAATKAPDLVKGSRDKAFEQLSAETILSFDTSTMSTLQTWASSAPPAMKASAQNAIRTIASDSRFYGKLSGEQKAALGPIAGITIP